MGKIKKYIFKRKGEIFPDPMILTFNITSGDTIVQPIALGGGGKALIDWGDGTKTIYRQGEDATNKTHTYTSTGNFDVSLSIVTGDYKVQDDAAYDTKITELKQWGEQSLGELNFLGCSNMIISATNIPNFTSSISFENLFNKCASITTIPNIASWDVSTILNMAGCFSGCNNWNDNISSWDVSSVTNMQGMFASCSSFNQPLTWTTTSLTGTLLRLFLNCSSFNQDLNTWDVSNVISLQEVFKGCGSFNGNVTNWNVGSVTSMSSTFEGCYTFNQNIGGWNTSNVTNMAAMFGSVTATNMIFNQDLSNWNVSKVSVFASMFKRCINFNLPLTNWVTTAATNMSGMFQSASSFNQPLSHFDMLGVTNCSWMFNGCSINQDISSWNITTVTTFFNFNGLFSTANYDLMLNAWSLQSVTPNVPCNFNAAYTIATSQAARDILTNAPNNWLITDGGGI